MKPITIEANNQPAWTGPRPVLGTVCGRLEQLADPHLAAHVRMAVEVKL